MSYDYSNYTQFGIKNDINRHLYAGWFIVVIILILLGDSTILVASIKYKAFNLQRIVVVFIQHIAVCDLMNAILLGLPNTISIICNSGGSSKILNYARLFVNYYIATMSGYLIAAMSLCKLILLKYPLRSRSWLNRQAHKICVGIWTATLSIPILHLAIDKDDVIFDYRLYSCMYSYSSSIWTILLPITVLLITVIPNSTIIVSTFLLLKRARALVRGTEEHLRWQGIITVVLTAADYTVSFLPVTVYFITEPFVKKEPIPGPFFVEFFRVANNLFSLHLFANFFIYSLTVNSFRSFLKTKVQERTSFLSTSMTSGAFYCNVTKALVHITVMSPHSDYTQRKCIAACCMSDFYAF